MHKLVFSLVIGTIGLILTCLGGLIGWWWMTALLGLIIGIIIRPAWSAVTVSLGMGGLGWGLPLTIMAFNAPVSRTATAVESLIALTASNGAVIIALTIVLGCLLSVVGTWVGITSRNLFIGMNGIEKIT